MGLGKLGEKSVLESKNQKTHVLSRGFKMLGAKYERILVRNG
jgi:hypothetical protein